MSKRPQLDVIALGQAAGPTRNPVDRLEERRSGRREVQGSRAGKVQIQGYFPPATRKRLKLLAVTSGRTMEELLAEALDDPVRQAPGLSAGPARRLDDRPAHREGRLDGRPANPHRPHIGPASMQDALPPPDAPRAPSPAADEKSY